MPMRTLWLLAALLLLPAPCQPVPYYVERQSVAPDGTQGTENSLGRALSADGGVVAFASAANLLGYTDNYAYDLFVRTRASHALLQVRSTAGVQGNDNSGEYAAAISADGRFAAFASFADNLVPGDTNGEADVFLHDRLRGTTSRVSVSSAGEQGNDDSGGIESLGISADGRYIAFASGASNLVAGDTNACRDVFVHDRINHTTARVSLAGDGSQGNNGSFCAAISGNGRYIAFASWASNLVAGDTNDAQDAFVYDRSTQVTTRVSVRSDGAQGNDGSATGSDSVAISSDGRFVAFDSEATNLVSDDTNEAQDVFVHDLVTGVTERVSVTEGEAQASGDSRVPAFSADGRFVGFSSTAANLFAGDTNGRVDAFVRDRAGGHTTCVSLAPGSAAANGASYVDALSADGHYALVTSLASDLVTGDTNDCQDAFLVANIHYTTPGGVPGPPTDLVARWMGGSRISLAWDDGSTNETGFLVEESNLPTSNFLQINATGPNMTSLVIDDPASATPLYYRVRAYDGAGGSGYATASVSRRPTDLAATALSPTSVRVTWTDCFTVETGYQVDRRIGTHSWQPVATLPAGSTSCTDTGCLRGTVYTYRVKATHPTGDSWYATVPVMTPTFDDVLPTSGQWLYVEALYREGITAGCRQTPPLYCPNASITRGQMAVFLCRAAGWSPMSPVTLTFSDVPAGHPQFGYVEAMWAHGVTSGCGGGKYCPDAPVSRGQMAVFLCRAAAIATRNPATASFSDVPKTSGQYTYVEGIYAAGITVGCVTTPPLQYCPDSPVTRGQMAVFLCRAFGLDTAIPTPAPPREE